MSWTSSSSTSSSVGIFCADAVDDLILVDADPERLRAWERVIEAFLAERLQLALKPERILRPVTDGADFLGYIVRPHYRWRAGGWAGTRGPSWRPLPKGMSARPVCASRRRSWSNCAPNWPAIWDILPMRTPGVWPIPCLSAMPGSA